MGKLLEIVIVLAIVGITTSAGSLKLKSYLHKQKLEEACAEITEALKLTELVSESLGQDTSLLFSANSLSFEGQKSPVKLASGIDVYRGSDNAREFKLLYKASNWASPSTIVVKNEPGQSCQIIVNRLGNIRRSCSF